MKRIAMIAGCVLAAACSPAGDAGAPVGDGVAAGNAILPAEPDMTIANAAEAPATPAPTDAWIGKWVGVEGLALDIAPGPDAGQYALKVSLLDGTGTYVGRADGEAIRFTRDGREESIRKASGDETGLKYLAGKKDCLMIREGEGFCRD
ncbi:hypothetical protein SAMN06295912_101302 [Sphingomonas laterariae]|uniref:Lipoprotein n=1 Tax=Edaphosphingomonas laterariae TaxID=861865 RepID=A0A239BQI1_9SPHN|nr:hypothetical protein [Sphingomonas laterariae]SNS09383.1 hypothetical protein SAMN06295912_101302 [Sphingomonas laterariae]